MKNLTMPSRQTSSKKWRAVPSTKLAREREHCVDMYNDLNEGKLIIKGEENSDNKVEQWVAKNLFMV